MREAMGTRLGAFAVITGEPPGVGGAATAATHEQANMHDAAKMEVFMAPPFPTAVSE
jgi:hypothetical protein